MSNDDVEQMVIGFAGGGSFAGGLSAGTMVVNDKTYAYIGDGASVNTASGAGRDQSVMVAAGSDLYHLGVAGAVAVGGTAAGGAGLDVAVVTLDTQAYIGAGAIVDATNNVTVVAHSDETGISVGVGIAGAGETGLAGSASVLILTADTLAYIGNRDGSARALTTSVQAGNNVLVSATDDTNMVAVDGAAGIGVASGGIGVTVPVLVINKDTEAFIADNRAVEGNADGTEKMTVLDGTVAQNGTDADFGNNASAQGVAVQANSIEDLFTLAVAGAGGTFFGVAGVVAVTIVQSITKAFIEDAAINASIRGAGNVVGANQSVNVAAANFTKVRTIAPSVSASLGITLGGAIGVGYVNNTTEGYIGDDASVTAMKDINAFALSDKSLDADTVSAAAGGTAINGSVNVFTLGEALDSSAQGTLSSNNTSAGTTASQTSSPQAVTNVLSGFTDSSNSSTTVSSGAEDFNPSSDIRSADNTITLAGTAHFHTGDAIIFSADGATPLATVSGPLVDGGTYYAIVPDPANDNVIELAPTAADAINGTNVITLSAASVQPDATQSFSEQQTTGNSALVVSNVATLVSTLNAAQQFQGGDPASTLSSTSAPDNGVFAFIGKNARVTATTGSIDIRAIESVQANLAAGGGGAGVAAFGAAVSVLNINSNTSAISIPMQS